MKVSTACHLCCLLSCISVLVYTTYAGASYIAEVVVASIAPMP